MDQVSILRPGIIYPESDGKPLGETEIHRQEITDAIETLRDYLRERADVYVGGNMFLYYEEGRPERSVVPDVFVVKGVSKQVRRIYQLWKEQPAPCFIIEVTSKSTRREDEREKLELYARLGVAEYFLFDPFAEYLKPPLRGYRLANGVYAPIAPDADGALQSRELGLLLLRENGSLRLIDLASNERLLKPFENAQARRAAEAELARLREELERLKGNQHDA
jgi:Uma2 family endonuclease